MNINSKATISKEKLPSDGAPGVTAKVGQMKLTAEKVIRWSGLAAIAAGVIFIVIQPIHPPDELASVSTSTWALIQTLKFSMGLLGLIGLTGIFARQVEESGWLGLAGYLLLSGFYALTTVFAFIEAYVAPVLVVDAPKFIDNILGLAFGNYSPNIGAIGGFYAVAGIMFLLGGLLLGIATFRAGVLPRWAGALLIFGAVSPPVLSIFITHPANRLLSAPISLALIWLGYSVFTGYRERSSKVITGQVSPQPTPIGIK
jgi:hypothetical protein